MSSIPSLRIRRGWLLAGGGLLLATALLLIPEPSTPAPRGAGRPVFEWRLDSFWRELERQMVAARRLAGSDLDTAVDGAVRRLRIQCEQLRGSERQPNDPAFLQLETDLFRLAPLVAAQPRYLADYISLVSEAHRLVKQQSRAWDLNSVGARHRLYRLLYGSRLALEEVLLQLPADAAWPEVLHGKPEPSATATADLLGVTVHSGDLLVSRGGAPTSALISRGNDYPGAFSHVALLHVDPATGQAVVIEAHIECGVKVSTVEQYLRDKKLRLLVLRPRADLPALLADPQLPHRAAAAALAEARRRHIPYDFAMNHRDSQELFCSEVASSAYARVGVKLWMGMSFLSAPTVTAWLASLGVRHFETQEPSDLEYDSQLSLVAEWRDRTTLFKAHVDDAVTDAMFERAPPGSPLPHQWLLLPAGRLAKAWSVLLNTLGRIGPIPEGLSTTAALRVSRYRAEHEALTNRVLALAADFRKEHGYSPPYWELVRLAREAARRADS